MKNVEHNVRAMWLLMVFALPLLIISCQNRTSLNEYDVPAIEVNASPSIVFSIDSIARLSHLVPLETLDGSLIGSIDKLIVTKDRIFVLDQERDRLLSFSPNGRFIGQVGRQGNGPQEYISLTDVSFDVDGNQLYIWDRIKSNLLVFTKGGDYVETRHANFDGNSMTVVGNHVYLYYSSENNPMQYDVISVDSNLQQMQCGYFPRRNISLPAMGKPCFTEENGGRYYCSIYSNTLFQIDESGVKPFYRLDFGDNEMPYDRLMLLKNRPVDGIDSKKIHLGHVSGMHVSKNLCFFSFDEILGDSYGRRYLGIINAKENSIKTFGQYASSPLLIDMRLLYITDDQQLVYAIYPNRFNPIYYDELRKYYPDVTPEDNPILVFFDLKQ